MKKGLIHLYCGEGKGKTSAALGLALRAAGRGLNVVILRLMKDCASGELNSLRKLKSVIILPVPEKLKFVFQMTSEEKALYRELVLELLKQAEAYVKNNQADVLIIDEACSAVTTGILELGELIEFLRNKKDELEVVLTGRNPPDEVVGLADYVSEIRKVKHPYDRDIGPRKGIEW